TSDNSVGFLPRFSRGFFLNISLTMLFSYLMAQSKTITKAPAGSKVAVLGASPKPDRFSFHTVHRLKEHGYKPIPVHPAGHSVDGVSGTKSLDDIKEPIDTLTMYVNAKISDELTGKILRLKPRRVIFNPGAENEELAMKLEAAGIEVVRHCTLVMLDLGIY
ncbi:MAG: CoA-binding protein, partial [Candidatus Zixiibacteriota bacterium]